jgi:iron complex outermembrane receptor protein
LSIPVNIGGAPGSTVSNAGKVQITGVEAELQAQLTQHLLVDANVSWLKYDIKDLGAAAGVAGGPSKGDIAPYVPERKAAVGIQYTADLGASGSLTPRLDYVWQSKSYADPDNNPLSEVPSYGLANLHLTWDSDDTQWQARLDISNVTDKFYWANVYSQYNAGGMIVGRPGTPRTFFVTVKRSF